MTTTALVKNSRKPRELKSIKQEICLDLPEGTPDEIRDHMFILVAILHGLCNYVYNPDVIALAVYNAQDICKAAGLDQECVKRTINAFVKHSELLRDMNPIAKSYS